MTASIKPIPPRARLDLETLVRRGCALVVAGVAAYSSYEHQRAFALRGGADATSAALWPLSVDGLLVLATVGLLASSHQTSHRMRTAVWSSFLLGIAVSLAANIAAAPTLAWQPVLVAGWPPVALLLAVELLAHQPRSRERIETEQAAAETELPTLAVDRDSETDSESAVVIALAEVSPDAQPPDEPTAQDIMWAHFQREQARGRIPTGAELDRVAKTNNYGRTVLRQWREQGRIESVDRVQHSGHRLDRFGQDGAVNDR